MIKEITELNFPKDESGKQYATLEKATVTFNDMGEKTITTQVSIDGQIRPDFSQDWEVVFKGEKYIMPLRSPQGSKANDSLCSKIDLTFQHWAQYQLKRWYFFTLASQEAEVVVADKYNASVQLPLREFCDLFGKLLNHYYDDKIMIQLNPDWEASEEPVTVDINHSYMWDVLIKIYDLYAVRWEIVPNGSYDRYVIRVGYPVQELNHIFEYGFEGGLLKVERQVQDDNIRNMLLGRGGEKNLPYRYFKNVDEKNPTFPADPDWVKELANVYFDRLRSAEFRSYVQGWKATHRNEYADDKNSRIIYSPNQAFASWAWEKGATDKKFDPVEYVKDDESIAKYGPLLGGLEDNENIYPTIQGVIRDGLGRVDEAVDVEQVTSDEIEEDASSKTTPLRDLSTVELFEPLEKKTVYLEAEVSFEVPQGFTANVTTDGITYKATYDKDWLFSDMPADRYEQALGEVGATDLTPFIIRTSEPLVISVSRDNGASYIPASGIPSGNYNRVRIAVPLEDTFNKPVFGQPVKVKVTVNASVYAVVADKLAKPSNTFDVWIKNIWETTKGIDDDGKPITETNEQYVERVWRKIVGDHLGNEAALCFATGQLAVSEDYQFKIVAPLAAGIHYDTSKTLKSKDGETYPSHWRLTLHKSDADLESLGVLTPNTKRQGAPGDYFYFVGIELTQYYIQWAEERLHNYKLDQLEKVKDIQPTWVVTLDKIRTGALPADDKTVETLIEQMKLGGSIRLADKRFIAESAIPLYLKTITYKYNETANSANLLPNIEIVLSDQYETTANPVSTLQSEVNAISNQLGSVSVANIEQIVRYVGDRIYLRKDGITDRSQSITYFSEMLAALGFRQGLMGGQGWGFFQDSNNKWVLETDRINVREEMQVNSLVINQIQARGGMTIESAASMEVDSVSHIGNAWRCHFKSEGGLVANLFRVNDIALCHRFTADNATLKYYKCRVRECGEDYIDLEMNPRVGNGEPAAGDVIVQYGNTTDKTRQFVIIRDVIDGGYERMLCNLNSHFAQGDEYFFAGRQSASGERLFIGSKEKQNWLEYKDGKLTISGSFSVLGKDGDKATALDDYLAQFLEDNGVTKENIDDFVNSVVDPKIEGIQNQIDGVIETWFGNGEPTKSNYPMNEWASGSDSYSKHLGDLYYDNLTGNAYRFSRNENGVYLWILIEDSAVVKALAEAARAQDTADNKRRVFVDKPTTQDEYDVGDLWVNVTANASENGVNYNYNNDILRCTTHKNSGALFSWRHWIKASHYTDDSALNDFILNYNGTIDTLKKQLDEKAETWYGADDPSETERPYGWLGEPNSEHIGDLWYDTSEGTTWYYTTDGWEGMPIPDDVFDMIDGKAEIFVTQPKNYHKRDLWFLNAESTNLTFFEGAKYEEGTLLVALNDMGSRFDPQDWTKKDRYTDDSALNKFVEEYQTTISEIESQLDQKAETWYQGENPATTKRPKGWLGEPDAEHIGDLWYCTSTWGEYIINTTYRWTGTKWEKMTIPKDVFDKFDGKADIFVSKPSSYNINDLWFLENDYTLGDGTHPKGTLVVATVTRENDWNANDWVKKDRYTDDTVAKAARDRLNAWAEDGVISPTEKNELKDEILRINADYNLILGNCQDYGLDYPTAYDKAYNTYLDYLQDLSADEPEVIPIPKGFAEAQQAYYNARTSILAEINKSPINYTDGQVAGYKYIKNALGESTTTTGGLILTSLIQLGMTNSSGTWEVWSGINGQPLESAVRGYGIAAWYGGDMYDMRFEPRDRAAKTLFRFDGSGYLASNNLKWDAEGNLSVSGDLNIKSLRYFIDTEDSPWNDAEEFSGTIVLNDALRVIRLVGRINNTQPKSFILPKLEENEYRVIRLLFTRYNYSSLVGTIHALINVNNKDTDFIVSDYYGDEKKTLFEVTDVGYYDFIGFYDNNMKRAIWHVVKLGNS